MHKYTQLKVLGRGGFGSAILAQCKDGARERVVIKEVKLAGLTAQQVADARKEAGFLAALRHPNIVAFRETFTESGKLYIVMEYADGGDLAGRIQAAKTKRTAISEEEALAIFVQLCLALKHIHDRRIIHRDLKSANIFLTAAGVVKLGDLGIARALGSSADLAKTQIGTPYFLSPELCCEVSESLCRIACACKAIPNRRQVRTRSAAATTAAAAPRAGTFPPCAAAPVRPQDRHLGLRGRAL